MNKKIIFGTGTPRSGGALLSNILSVHNDISITTDLVHFFRHIYKKYCPISKSSNQSKLVYELCVRIKYRQQIILSPEEMLSHFDKVENYSDVIAAISDFFLRKNTNKKFFGEYENGEWRNIKNFLELDKNYKSFQVIRDPRAILTSWKKLTYVKEYKYLNVIFNWIDAINYSENYLREYTKERYLRIKFEDVHNEPKESIKTICGFADIKFDPNMLRTETWPNLLNTKFNYVNVSSYNNQKMYGFSKERTVAWKNHIEDWEVTLIQHLLQGYLKQLNYEIIDCDKNLLSKGLSILENDELLSKNYYHFKKTNTGTDKRLNDPSKPENWAASNTSKNISAKFIDTEDYKNYLNEMNEIKKKIAKITN